MLRAAIFAFAVLAGPAFASSPYHAEPAAMPAETRLVVRDTLWKCGDAGCVAGESNSRPAIVCAALAKKVGTLRSFSAGGHKLPPEALQKCNARAR